MPMRAKFYFNAAVIFSLADNLYIRLGAMPALGPSSVISAPAGRGGGGRKPLSVAMRLVSESRQRPYDLRIAHLNEE